MFKVIRSKRPEIEIWQIIFRVTESNDDVRILTRSSEIAALSDSVFRVLCTNWVTYLHSVKKLPKILVNAYQSPIPY